MQTERPFVGVETKKIGLFAPSLDGGGAERVMVTLANAFANRGYSTDLVLASARGPYLADVSPDVQIVDLRTERVIKAVIPLARYLRRERPDALLSAMTHANVVALMAKALSRAGTRLVVSERTTISRQASVERSLSSRLVYRLARFLYPRADAICAVSGAAANDLAEFVNIPKERVEATYNPFDLDRLTRKAAEGVDHPWFTEGEPPVVLGIGRLSEEKDFTTLIRAFARVRQTQKARLMILGEGGLRDQLADVIKECSLTPDDVELPGFVRNPYAYLARCGVFVLSSRWEGLPGVLIEALACGAPVISANCLSGPDEILQGGRWGRLVPVGDVAQLADVIGKTLNTSRQALPNGRIRAQDFALDRVTEIYLRLLQA